MTPHLTITSAQIHSLPLLLGVIENMGIRWLIDAHVTPHGAWQGASVGIIVSVWLSRMLGVHDRAAPLGAARVRGRRCSSS